MNAQKPTPQNEKAEKAQTAQNQTAQSKATNTKPDDETGGFGKKGNGLPEPTRFGDWEVKGRCSDF